MCKCKETFGTEHCVSTKCDRPSPHEQAVAAKVAQPHKHAATIKAWADGAEIQQFIGGKWHDVFPSWNEKSTFRVKPTPVPLWAIAHDTFFRHPEHLDTSRQTKWQAVADAVVKAYEERTMAHEERKASNF